MDDIKAKQEIVEKITSSTNILVTVSNSPSVDALSAALGLTLLLDKLEKHPTAVFSGAVPPAISFLEPEKTFDSTTDSLRDFIIALDKEKADHLKYKVEGDSVKIFITPYRTTITSKDLDFSQGDYNVELVIALGVDNQDHLDAALESHGQILHDATIITVTAGDQTSTLGGIDWNDPQASSMSEMVAGLAEALKTDPEQSLLDSSIATAFLTGIVAQTDRFSNTHTTSRVMTIAAQLMSAGADQQLIASKLEESHEIGETSKQKSAPAKNESKDSISIEHDPNETLEQMDKRVKAAEKDETPETETTTDAYGPDAEADNEDIPASTEVGSAYGLDPEDSGQEPSLGGSLSATTEQASDDARHEAESDQNKTILSHAYVGTTPTAPIDAPSVDPGHDFLGSNVPAGSSSVNSGAGAAAPAIGDLVHSAYGLDTPSTPEPAAPTPASSVMPAAPIMIEPIAPPVTQNPGLPPMPPAPADLGLPMPPAVPDFSQPPVMPSTAYTTPPAPKPEILGDILAPEPAQPAAVPFMPTPAGGMTVLQPLPPQPIASPILGPTDPGQFKIPGQQ
ncbi:MAG: hypothetical protein ABIP50_00390 [Candidatus Saccharimonadales bacterium]